jgi:hypothetical protein
MRLSASEKLEIIRLVEQSHLPARRTLEILGIKPAGSIVGMTGSDRAVVPTIGNFIPLQYVTATRP